MRVAILSSSIRDGRKSHHVALHLERSVTAAGDTADLIDLRAYRFPLFEERLKYQKAPAPNVVEFAQRIREADGVIVVTPEYNGGLPASLKNVIDLLSDEWNRKPIALCSVSNGAFAGSQVLVSLLFSLWKIRAWVVPSPLRVGSVQDAFGEDGMPIQDTEGWQRRTSAFLADLAWAMEAKRRMSS